MEYKEMLNNKIYPNSCFIYICYIHLGYNQKLIFGII